MIDQSPPFSTRNVGKAAHRSYAGPLPTLGDRQIELLEQFDADPYDGICSVMRGEAYQSAPDHYLDVHHPDYEPGLLSHHIDHQIQRVFIDMVNNCDTGAEYEQFILALRLRFAGINS